MQKLLSTFFFFLTSFPLLAATTDMDKASAPADTVSMLYVIIFCVIFVGMIAGFFIYLFMTDKDKKPEQK